MTLSCDDVRDLAAGFVLGALEPDEAAAVREHLTGCPEAHAEIAELGGVVPYLADTVEPVEPPAALRTRILAAAAAEQTGTPPIPFPSAGERASRTEPSARRRATIGEWVLRIAAVLAIAALGAWNLQLQGRVSDVERDLETATAYQQGVARVLEVAVRDGATTAIIAPAEGAPTTASGFAASAPDGTVVIAMQDLAPTTGTEVYEAWVIVGSDAPVPLGGFAVGPSGTGVLTTSTALAGPGAILALTREPGPGATVPTLPVLTVGALAEGA